MEPTISRTVTAEQVAALDGSELVNQFLTQFNRLGLESLMVYVSGHSPDIAAAALRHVTASLERHPGLYAADDPAAPAPAPVIAGLPVPPLSAGVATSEAGALAIGDREMTSRSTRHSARMCTPALPGSRSFWDVTWLPGRCLDRNQAITAMMIAQHVHHPAPDIRDRTPAWNRTPEGGRWWAILDSWAAELGLTGPHALSLASMSPEDAAATVSA